MKATFSIALITKPNNVNLSNMPVVSEEPFLVQDADLEDGSWKRTQFDVSPPVRALFSIAIRVFTFC